MSSAAVSNSSLGQGSNFGKRDKEEETEPSPFAGVQKNAVVREARNLFSQSQPDVAKCIKIMTQILWILNQGDEFSKDEGTDLFFAATKLFQSQDFSLRRLMYLIFKDLRIASDEAIIVVAGLSKDMTSKIDLFRANSIRVLAKIMDANMAAQMDRFLKQALVDKDPVIVNSALVAGQHLYKIAPDVVKRWTNEVQEALMNENRMVQFQGLSLLYLLKANDKLAISKVISTLTRTPPTGPLAQCLQIRIVTNLLRSMAAPNADLLRYLDNCLRDKHFMVMYEAAKALCSLEMLTAPQLTNAVAVLQELLYSPNSVQRFAAVRTLSEVVIRHPQLVDPCSSQLETLLTDANRNIATLAITTLLKTGVENNIDRLMKSISGFMADISDDFKIVLIDSIRVLALKYPIKHTSMMNYLAASLREEGGFKFKKAIVDAMLEIINAVPESKELGLEHFCEFIEDCEFPELSVKIIHVIGEKGPKLPNPAKCIRFLFNRVILETAAVRAASVNALAKYAAVVPALTDNIIVLLNRCIYDDDDEVRDRAVMARQLLDKALDSDREAGISATTLPVITEEVTPAQLSAGRRLTKAFYSHQSPVNLASFEQSLVTYLASANNFAAPFSLAKHLVSVPDDVAERKDTEKRGESKEDKSLSGTTEGGLAKAAANPYLEVLNSIPELASLGPVFKSSSPVDLTEKETEYVVSCIKHIYPQHVVFQFNVTNNMEDQQLENVTVEMETDAEGWSEELIVPEPQLKYQAPGVVFVAFNRPAQAGPSGPIACTLKFTVKEVDDGEVSAMGTEDEYQLEEIEVTEGDFMAPGPDIGIPDFKRQWETLGDSNEVVKKYSLGLDGIQAAIDAVLGLLSMTPCESSGKVAEGAATHLATMTGKFYGDVPVLARAGFVMDQKHGVTLKIAVRSPSAQVSGLVANAIR